MAKYATLARSALMISESNDPGRPQQVAEVAGGKKEWKVRDNISTEVILAAKLLAIPFSWIKQLNLTDIGHRLY
jgi:hypothetical protein